MEVFKINPLYSVLKVNKQNFLENSDAVIDMCLSILVSHETKKRNYEQQKICLYDLCSNLYLDDENAIFYILTNNNQPVSFCIYSQRIEKNAFVLEMIYTHKQYTNVGLATKLLETSLQNLKTSGVDLVMLTVSNRNESSLRLHNKLIEQGIVKGKAFKEDNVTKFYLDVQTLNLDNDKEYSL